MLKQLVVCSLILAPTVITCCAPRPLNVGQEYVNNGTLEPITAEDVPLTGGSVSRCAQVEKLEKIQSSRGCSRWLRNVVKLRFAKNETAINDDNESLIREVHSFIASPRVKVCRVELVGHAYLEEPVEEISLARAKNAKSALVKLGVESQTITTVGSREPALHIRSEITGERINIGPEELRVVRVSVLYRSLANDCVIRKNTD